MTLRGYVFLAKVLGMVLLGFGCVMAKMAYDSSLRKEGALQVQMEFAIRQQQMLRKDLLGKAAANKAFLARAEQINARHRETIALIAEWRNTRDDELTTILSCSLPAEQYKQLCEQIDCAAPPVRAPEARPSKNESGAVARAGGT